MTAFEPDLKMMLAPTIGPAMRQSGHTLSSLLDRLAKEGFRSVQLDATLPGLKPRELSSTARRDLRAMFTRRDMKPAGLDLFIPRKDLLDPARMDRAMSAIQAAIELAADLGRLPLSMALPVGELSSAALESLVETADSRGATLAIHAEDQLQTLRNWVTVVDLPILGMAMDPANLIARNIDPEEAVHHHARRLVVARLSDFLITGGGHSPGPKSTSLAKSEEAEASSSVTGLRCHVGQGELNLQGYRLAVELARGRLGPVVLDLRQMENVMRAAASGQAAWDKAALTS